MNKNEINDRTSVEQRQSLVKCVFELPDTEKSLNFLKNLKAVYPAGDKVLDIAFDQKIATIEMLQANRSLEAALDRFCDRFSLVLGEAGAAESK